MSGTWRTTIAYVCGQPVTVYACRECGALIADAEQHAAWHDDGPPVSRDGRCTRTVATDAAGLGVARCELPDGHRYGCAFTIPTGAPVTSFTLHD